MTLSELLRTLGTESSSDDDGSLTIYALRPWLPTSAAAIIKQPENGALPETAVAHGLDYFIEVSIAQDWLKDWPSSLKSPAEYLLFCERLIRYAENDA